MEITADAQKLDQLQWEINFFDWKNEILGLKIFYELNETVDITISKAKTKIYVLKVSRNTNACKVHCVVCLEHHSDAKCHPDDGGEANFSSRTGLPLSRIVHS